MRWVLRTTSCELAVTIETASYNTYMNINMRFKLQLTPLSEPLLPKINEHLLTSQTEDFDS